MKLALQVRQGDVEIQHRHVGRGVAEEFHDGGKADAGTKHLCGIGVSHLVRNDARGDAHRKGNLVQVVAQLAHQGFFGAGAGQQQTVRGKRIEGAEEARALDEFKYRNPENTQWEARAAIHSPSCAYTGARACG